MLGCASFIIRANWEENISQVYQIESFIGWGWLMVKRGAKIPNLGRPTAGIRIASPFMTWPSKLPPIVPAGHHARPLGRYTALTRLYGNIAGYLGHVHDLAPGVH